MKTLRSVLKIPRHKLLGSKEIQILEREFSGEQKTTDDGYNVLAKQLGITFLEAKSTLGPFKFVAAFGTATCILFEDPPDSWGCYIVSNDAETCSTTDTKFRSRLERVFGSPITQSVTSYPSWERPKDLKQFLLATVSNLISAILAVLVPQVGLSSSLASALILALLIPIVLFGGWSIRGR